MRGTTARGTISTTSWVESGGMKSESAHGAGHLRTRVSRGAGGSGHDGGRSDPPPVARTPDVWGRCPWRKESRCLHHTHQECSRRVVELARLRAKPITAIGKDQSISESCLRNWINQADIDDGSRPGPPSDEHKELAELRRDKRRLEMEVEILQARGAQTGFKGSSKHRHVGGVGCSSKAAVSTTRWPNRSSGPCRSSSSTASTGPPETSSAPRCSSGSKPSAARPDATPTSATSAPPTTKPATPHQPLRHDHQTNPVRSTGGGSKQDNGVHPFTPSDHPRIGSESEKL